MPVVSFIDELKLYLIFLCTDVGNAFSATKLQILVRDSCTWAHCIQESLYETYIIEFICTSTFVEVYNGEMDNNGNSSREILIKEWIFYQRFSELIFRMRNYYAFGPLETSFL